jgi:hypothetical protein
MGDWQPIETAPRDGTEILVWWPTVKVDDDYNLTSEEVGGARLITEWHGGSWLEPDCLNALNSVTFGDDTEYAEEPRLWQPLPPPPSHAQQLPDIE